MLAPQPDQLLINTCSHQRLYKKHAGREVCTTVLFQKPVISLFNVSHPNITLETKLNWHSINSIYPMHNIVIFYHQLSLICVMWCNFNVWSLERQIPFELWSLQMPKCVWVHQTAPITFPRSSLIFGECFFSLTVPVIFLNT